MQSLFTKIGLNVTRWAASEPHEVMDGFQGSPTQKACGQSHLNIWLHMLKNNLPYALILEDDIAFDANWRTRLESFPHPSFDLILLNTDHYYGDPYAWQKTHGNSWLSAAYVVSLEAVKELVKGPYFVADKMLVNYQKATENKRCYSYFPYLAIQRSVDSDIEGSHPDFIVKCTRNHFDLIKYSLDNYIF